MYLETIYKIRENKELYLYLKYNSHLYKKIIRNEISLKELDSLKRNEFKQTTMDKLNSLKDKIDLANTFLSILK